ncbi:DUF1176 domain-containing protein [Pseudoxanthomonas sp. 22568]|uniref:DUF1176 domain-containing protein n=1 Tax=Pseudoxanthomonas sp. 22568 TaxID=3453945 RepID=UPI003F870EB1
MRRLLPLLLLCVSASACATTPVYRQFKDWVVACDNTARCEARGANEISPLMLRLIAEAGPAGGLSLALESGVPVDLATLRVDGKPLALEARHWTLSPEQDGMQTLDSHDPDRVRALLKVLRNGHELTFGDGERERGVPLDGLSASLLLIDETQGRLGNVTALLRSGDKPASQVPAAPAPPPAVKPASALQPLDDDTRERLIGAVRRAQSALLETENCHRPAGDDSTDNTFDIAVGLTPREALVLIECWRGAYQSSHMAFRTPMDRPADARRLVLPTPTCSSPDEGRQAAWDAFTNAGYNNDESVLYHMAKGRGLADCGESASWVFDGRDFQLVQWNYLGSRRGGEPGDWPALWRSAGSP